MDSLVRRFKDKTTSEGHPLVVSEESGVISIGFTRSDDSDDDFEPFINVARIERTGSGFHVGWFYDDGEEPCDSSEFGREEDVVDAVNKEIEERSKAIGPSRA
jgi:hypothetical protein